MGRELRMVPPNWKHPRDKDGDFIPLLKQTANQWREAERQWSAGFVSDYKGGWEPKGNESWHKGLYSEYAGELGDDKRMPDFAPGTATHFCMYEDTSEGTPISPAFATAEELARWLADNNASAFAGMGATYEQWLATIKRGSALSMIIDQNGMRPGVAM